MVGELELQLHRSDQDYFSIGARIERLESFCCFANSSFAKTPLGLIAFCEEDQNPNISGLEEYASGEGFDFVRVYSHNYIKSFELAGFSSRIEYTLVMQPQLKEGLLIKLLPIEGQADWQRKAKLYGSLSRLSDGYHYGAEDWIGFEQSKSVGGYQFFLGYLKNELVSTIGFKVSPSFTRLKNLFVHPDYRFRGIGGQTIHSALSLLSGRTKWVGCYSLEKGDQCVYQKVGFKPLGKVVEWSKARQ